MKGTLILSFMLVGISAHADKAVSPASIAFTDARLTRNWEIDNALLKETTVYESEEAFLRRTTDNQTRAIVRWADKGISDAQPEIESACITLSKQSHIPNVGARVSLEVTHYPPLYEKAVDVAYRIQFYDKDHTDRGDLLNFSVSPIQLKGGRQEELAATLKKGLANAAAVFESFQQAHLRTTSRSTIDVGTGHVVPEADAKSNADLASIKKGGALTDKTFNKPKPTAITQTSDGVSH